MGFMDFLRDIGDSFGAVDERTPINTPAKTKLAVNTKPRTISGSASRNAARGAPLRQALPKEKLIIDPNTRKQATPDYLARMAAEQAQPEEDPLQGLLDALEMPYDGARPGYDDTESLAALDAALGITLNGIQGLRDTTKSNFAESDSNLMNMHNAYQKDIQTNGAAEYNGISDRHNTGLTASRDEALNKLGSMESESQAKRAAMLRSLGIEEAAAAPESTVIKDAQANITGRTATDTKFAEDMRATNQTYNTGVAQSVGAAGVERRSALNQQLQKANTTIDAQEMDARSQYQNQRAGIAAQKAGQQNVNADFEYGMYRDKQDGLRGMLDSFAQGGEEADPVKTNGYAGLAQDLVNSGIDQGTASNAMRTHAELVGSSEYMKARQSGKDATSWLVGEMTKKGLPVSVAMQVVTNYNNLGSTSGYTAVQ